MAISSPYVQQNKQDPYEGMKMGIQLGQTMANYANAQEQQRQFDVGVDEKQISEWRKDPMGLIQRVRENEDWFKRYLGKKFNMRYDSAEVEKMYQDLSTNIQSPEEMKQNVLARAILLGEKGGAEPPPVKEDENKMPAPDVSNLSAPVQTEVTKYSGGTLDFPQFVRTWDRFSTDPNAGGLGKLINSLPDNGEKSLYAKGSGEMIKRESTASGQLTQIDELKKLYDKYKASGKDGTAFVKAAYYGDAQPGTIAKLPAEKPFTSETVTVQSGTGNVATIDNVSGVIKPVATDKKMDMTAIYDSVQKNYYKGKTTEEAKDALWVMNEKALVDFYGSPYAAKRAFDTGEWVKDADKVELRVKQPKELTMAEQAKIAGTNDNRAAMAAKAEENIGQLNRDASGWGYMSPEKAQRKSEFIAREAGLLAKTLDITGPGGKERYKEFVDNDMRILNNISGGQGFESLMKSMDPLQIELVKLMQLQQMFPIEMDLKKKALEIDNQRLIQEGRLGSLNYQLKSLELMAALNGDDESSKSIKTSYKLLTDQVAKWQKDTDAKDVNLAEVVNKSPAAMVALQDLNTMLLAKKGISGKSYRIRTTYNQGLLGKREGEISLTLAPELAQLFRSTGDIIGETSEPAKVQEQKKSSSNFNSLSGDYGLNTGRGE